MYKINVKYKKNNFDTLKSEVPIKKDEIRKTRGPWATSLTLKTKAIIIKSALLSHIQINRTV